VLLQIIRDETNVHKVQGNGDRKRTVRELLSIIDAVVSGLYFKDAGSLSTMQSS
jgi:hypothetical protein